MKTAPDLRQLLQSKWGYTYDVQLRRVRNRMYFQVMWRYLEQVSFPWSEAEYLAHLQEILLYLDEWQVTDQVWHWLEQTRERPRLGRAVSLPLTLGQRAGEWWGEPG